jgi:hypothetical protein
VETDLKVMRRESRQHLRQRSSFTAEIIITSYVLEYKGMKRYPIDAEGEFGLIFELEEIGREDGKQDRDSGGKVIK